MTVREGALPRSTVNIFVDLASGILLVVLLACVVARYVFNVQGFSVLTGSMRPALEVGDLVVVTPTDYGSIRVGDMITFVLNEDLDVATHRVVAKNAEDQTLVTKGDANEEIDATPVDARNVVGVVYLHVPKAGYVLSFLSTLSGKIVAVTAIIALTLLGIIVRSVVMSDADGGRDELESSDVGSDAMVMGGDGRQGKVLAAPAYDAASIQDLVRSELMALDSRAAAAGNAMREMVLANGVYKQKKYNTAFDEHRDVKGHAESGWSTPDAGMEGIFDDGIYECEYDDSNCGGIVPIEGGPVMEM